MLTAAPKGCFSWNYAVSSNDDHLADIDISAWREKGVLNVAGQRYPVYRERLMSGRFILESDGGIVAAAEKPSAWSHRLLIEHAGSRYELKPRGVFSQAFNLRAGADVVGSISPRSMFSRRMIIDLPESLPLPVRLFIAWLVAIMWNRDLAAASGSG